MFAVNNLFHVYLQENHAIAKMTARCAQLWVPWKLYAYVSAKSADDCARISTLQSYH